MHAIETEVFAPTDFADPDAYQRAALVTWTRNPIPESRYLYLALGVVDEAGEVAGKIKKMHRDAGGKFTPELRAAICKELGDVLWYTSMLAHEAGYTLSEVIAAYVERVPARRIMGRATLAASTLRMCVCAGRVAACVSDGAAFWTAALADLVRAIENVAVAAGLTLEEVMAANINKLRGRQARGTIHGSGDDR